MAHGRRSSAASTEEEGDGLGLSIGADVVHEHGGQIRVTSDEGAGARFEIRLPIVTDSASNGPIQPPPPTLSRKRLLVVDDDHLVRRAIVRGLPRHDVVDVASADEGLAVLASQPSFDAILCDIMMPGKDGLAFYEEVSARFPDHRHRVVFVTGGAFTRRVCSFLERSDVPVVHKPVSARALEEALESVKRRAESMR